MRATKRWFRQHLSWPYNAALGIRTSYRKAVGPGTLRRRAARAASVKLVIGASGCYDEGWIPTDVEYFDLLDESHWQRALSENSVDAMLAEHVWEHLTPQQGEQAARRCFRYLKPGGYLRVAVPDGNHPNPRYIEWVKIGGRGPGAHDHKVLYDEQTFRDLFQHAGFQVEMLEYYDSAGEFHRAGWNPEDGKIHRVKGRPTKSGDFPDYSSLILDARKPG
jgi:predicted SAM-dependent methyltransferase